MKFGVGGFEFWENGKEGGDCAGRKPEEEVNISIKLESFQNY